MGQAIGCAHAGQQYATARRQIYIVAAPMPAVKGEALI